MTRLSNLACVSETKAMLEAYGLATKKSLGQHFLVNDAIVRRICEMAELSAYDVVVEIGPGIGTLTLALLQQAGQVISIERDKDLWPVLQNELASDTSFTLVCKDALKVDAQDFPIMPNKLVANLPYAVAATLVLDYFERFASIQSATVMVQAEVADRMQAKPGTKNYGAYTVKLGLCAHATGSFGVSEGNFFPPPRVKSTVIHLERNSRELPYELREAVMIMADAAFATRRKTIFNSMKTFFDNPQIPYAINRVYLEQLLHKAHIDPKRRGESLTQEEFIALGQAYVEMSATS